MMLYVGGKIGCGRAIANLTAGASVGPKRQKPHEVNPMKSERKSVWLLQHRP